MEFPELGKQCMHSSCKQLDFIPLKCQCLGFYCKEHFSEHCLSGECSYHAALTKEPQFNPTSQIYKCTFQTCRNASFLKLPCPKCSNHYCIEHRFHPECPEIDPEVLLAEKIKWETPRKQFEKAKALVEAEITKNLRNSQKNSEKSKTAFKIQLMKVKSKAKGESSVPTVNRIYFSVRKPTNNTIKTLVCTPKSTDYKPDDNLNNAVYVSNEWSLGRVIDSISKICSIKNENNDAKAPKLRMFREPDGMAVNFKEMDKKLSWLIENEILINGDRVSLEYISSDDLIASDEQQLYFLEN